MALISRRATAVNALFCRAVISSFLPLRSFKVQKTYGKKLYAMSKTSEEDNVKTSLGIVGDSNRKIYVGNLNNSITEDRVFEYFSKYGKIEILKFFRHKLNKLPRGFAFVTFCETESTQKVLAEAGSHVIDDRKVTVEIPREAVKQAKPHKRELTVLVTNILNGTNKQAIEGYFSQFGKVDRVIVAKKDPLGENTSSYYVMFSSLSEVKKALEQSTQRIADQEIDSQVTGFVESAAQNARRYLGETDCIYVRSIPDCLTVENLRDYFVGFGDVKSVDLLVNGSGITSGIQNERSSVAFVHFTDRYSINKILEDENHVIGDSQVKVSTCLHVSPANLASEEIRSLKLSVEGLPLSTRPAAVQEYFESTFGIVLNGVFLSKDQMMIHKKLLCIVRLSNTAEVERVLRQEKRTFQGHPLQFRRVFWRKSKTK